MKKTICLLAILVTGFTGMFAQDLTPKLVSFNYDFQTALITNLEVEVENLDNFSVTDDYIIHVHVDGIGTISCLGAVLQADWFNHGSVPANGTLTYSLPNIDLDDLDNTCGLPTGNYHLRVVLDVNDDVDEDDETNNEGSFTNDDFYFESLATSVNPGNQLGDIEVYPNPAQDQFRVQRGEFVEDLELEILSLEGKLLQKQTIVAGQSQAQINVEAFQAGLYLLRFSGEGQQRTQKLLIQ